MDPADELVAETERLGLYPEHICYDGYPDWGPPEGCPNCDRSLK